MVRSYPSNRRAMPVGSWPETDQTAWRRAVQPAGLLDLRAGPAAHLRPTTLRQYENGYGRWLTWLECNHLLDRQVRAGDRATEARVRAFHQSLLDDGLAPYSVAERLMSLAQVLRSLEPELDFSWISLAARRTHRHARPVKDMARDLPPSDELFQLGLDLLHEADEGRFRSGLDRMRLFRDGLIIALVAKRPLRGKNLAEIEIGWHLNRRGKGWWLSFSGAEMKNGHPFSCSWPPDLVKALERYLAVYRPTVARDKLATTYEPTNHLWISTVSGRRLRSGDVAVRIKLWTQERFGHPVNPQRFRHSAATTTATTDPAGATEIAAILGHSTLKTSQDHYNLATAIEATGRCQDVIAAKRRRLGVRGGLRGSTAQLFLQLAGDHSRTTSGESS